ncbi:MAG: TatD family hydrolase [Candidatus Micrarchaeota archaeon]
MKFVDAHCHLLHEKFASDLPQVLERARKADVLRVYCVSGLLAHDVEVLELAARHPQFIFPVIGASPHDAPRMTGDELEQELALIEQNAARIAAVGEIGFEFHYFTEDEERRAQYKVFRAQLELAESLDKPVVIHSREASVQTLAELASFKGRVMLHCCSDPLLAEEGVKRGWLVSQPTLKSRIREKIMEATPLERLCCETDAPLLSPVPRQRNEPANVRLVYEEVARVKKKDLQEVSLRIFENIKEFFGG